MVSVSAVCISEKIMKPIGKNLKSRYGSGIDKIQILSEGQKETNRQTDRQTDGEREREKQIGGDYSGQFCL